MTQQQLEIPTLKGEGKAVPEIPATLPEITPEATKEIALREFRIKLQNFTKRLSKKPKDSELQEYQGQRYLPISYIEMELDELYFGLWETYDFKWERIFNEVVGSLILEVTHPVTGQKLRRVGASAVIITQDANTTLAQFNESKKKNALDTAFPKLKAECLKNAALSLGKKFGRDVNRKHTDEYNPIIKEEEELN